MDAVASLSRDTTLGLLDVAQIAVFVFGLFFLVGWIAEETTKDHPWNRYSAAFVVMAIIGVAGEWIADIGVFALSEHLQTISDKELAKLNLKAQRLTIEEVNARKAIADANERAAQAGKTAEQARLAGTVLQAQTRKSDVRIAALTEQAATARARIAEAEARANEANAQVAVANEKAEAERLARVKLGKAVSWRDITQEQSRSIAAALRPFAGEKLDVFAYRDEPDAWLLAVEISVAVSAGLTPLDPAASPTRTLVFRREHWWGGWKLDPKASGLIVSSGAGWDVKVFRVVEYDRGGAGMEVETSADANSTDLAAAKALVSALKAANLEVDGPFPAESEHRRDAQLISGSGKPIAPIELTVMFRPPPDSSERK